MPTDTVHIFYYPWYGAPSTAWGGHWEQGGHNPLVGDIGAAFYPQLGPYDSLDPGIIAQHMAWIAQAGCGVVVTSWWGRGSREDAAVPKILNAAHAAGLSVAFHIEPYGGRTPQSALSDISYLHNTYGSHPAYYTTACPTGRSPNPNPRPAIYVFEVPPAEAAAWATTADAIRGTPYDAILLGHTGMMMSDVYGEVAWDSHFDGMYSYAAFTSGGPFESIGSAMRYIGNTLGGPMLWVPCVGPGYDDRRAVLGSTRVLPRMDGARYAGLWHLALASQPNWIGVTSFNEWHEGSQIEPCRMAQTVGSRPAYMYLDHDGDFLIPGPPSATIYLHMTRMLADATDRMLGG